MGTDTCESLRSEAPQADGWISRYKMCLGDPEGGNVTGGMKNSLYAELRAVHRQVMSRTSSTLCDTITVNAACINWGGAMIHGK